MEDLEEKRKSEPEDLGGLTSPRRSCSIGSIAKDTVKKLHQCNRCAKGFEAEEGLRLHVLSHEKEELDKRCSGATTAKVAGQQREIGEKGPGAWHHPEKEKPDQIKTVTTSGGSQVRNEKREVKKPHLCDVCGKRFQTARELDVHKRVHIGDRERIYKCTDCEKRFLHQGSMRMHHNTVHLKKFPQVCEVCGKGFRNCFDLRRHSVTHTGEKPHDCEVCGKRFSQSIHLKTHLLTHTGEKKHNCEVCGMVFAKAAELKEHWLVHTAEKPYACEQCGKRFSEPGVLQRHQSVHNKKMKHTCSYCGKGFRLLSTMNIHVLLHTGEKPHACSECGKRFSQLWNLKTHLRIHTGEKPYACEVCGRRFGHKCILKNHTCKRR